MKTLLMLTFALSAFTAQAEELSQKAFLIVNQDEMFINGVDKLPLLACNGQSYAVAFQSAAAAKSAYSLPSGVYGCQGEFAVAGNQLKVFSLGQCQYVSEAEFAQACK